MRRVSRAKTQSSQRKKKTSPQLIRHYQNNRTMMKNYPGLGKILYGLLFTAVLPALLVVWAMAAESAVKLPVVGSFAIGAVLALCGLGIMLLGMAALMIYGKGLPMNAYPPAHYVTRGVYRLVPHPIYTGFCLLCVGVSIAAHSAAGFWLVSPVVILGCVALVEGFEKHDLRARFPSANARPLLSLPAPEYSAPTAADRVAIYLLVFLPWLILYQMVRLIGIPPDAIVAYMPFEHEIPVYEWTELFYAGAYPFVLLVPFIARTKRDLREFAISGLLATGVITLLFLVIPFIAPPRAFTPHTLLGTLLEWERGTDTPAAAFPSFHAAWAFIAAAAYARALPSWRVLWWALAVCISISCITTGMHAIVDIAAAVVVFLLIRHRQKVWQLMRRSAERVANSWKEWRIGPVRIINHGLYAGAGAFAGLSIAGILIGPAYIAPMLVMGVCIIVTAAVWAQVVEGSPALLRPYGWYGGLLGALFGALISQLFGADAWLLLAAFCVGVPWVQAAGRLRCLVQGCCHGRETSEHIGIRYTHPRSRVCRLTELGGVAVHPTPLYSILCNVVIAVVVARLWFLHVPAAFIVGIYLIMNGLGRFVEESYRGEPQTTVYAGLRLYQWLAVASVLAGIILTMIDGTAHTPHMQVNRESVLAAACFGLFTTAALGVDLPGSNKRFSRLA